MREQDRASRTTNIRWTPEQYRTARRLFDATGDQCRTFSQFVRIMVLHGRISTRSVFTDPAQIRAAINKVGANIDSLLATANAGYGIYPGEIQDLADQMEKLNQQLDKWWADYKRSE